MGYEPHPPTHPHLLAQSVLAAGQLVYELDLFAALQEEVMSLNQDETREWTVLLRITEHPGLGDHPWWTRGQLADVIHEKLTAICIDEVVARQTYLEVDLDDLLHP